MTSSWLDRALEPNAGIKIGELTLIGSFSQNESKIEQILWKASPLQDEYDYVVNYILANQDSTYFRIKFLIILSKLYINRSYRTHPLDLNSIKPILDITDTWENEWFIVLSSSVNKTYIGNNETIENYRKIIV